MKETLSIDASVQLVIAPLSSAHLCPFKIVLLVLSQPGQRWATWFHCTQSPRQTLLHGPCHHHCWLLYSTGKAQGKDLSTSDH